MSNIQFDLVQRMSNAIASIPQGQLRDRCEGVADELHEIELDV